MVAATLQRSQLKGNPYGTTHCGNCPFNRHGVCTAPRSGYPVQDAMPVTAICDRDLRNRFSQLQELRCDARKEANESGWKVLPLEPLGVPFLVRYHELDTALGESWESTAIVMARDSAQALLGISVNYGKPRHIQAYADYVNPSFDEF